jgi:hypothetical protein
MLPVLTTKYFALLEKGMKGLLLHIKTRNAEVSVCREVEKLLFMRCIGS